MQIKLTTKARVVVVTSFAFVLALGVAIGCSQFRTKSPTTQSTEPPDTYTGKALQIQSEMGTETSYFTRLNVPGDRQTFASQLRLTSGLIPSLTVSWPAGNEGIYIKFVPLADSSHLTLKALRPPEPISLPENSEKGSEKRQRGIKAVVRVEGAGPENELIFSSINAGPMRMVREFRDYKAKGSGIEAEGVLSGDTITATRESIDHETKYIFKVRGVSGTSFKKNDEEKWVAKGGIGQPIEFEITATCDEPPMTPIAIEDVVNPEVIRKSKAHDLAEFNYLIYEEAFLAGADNYLTMFGRDNEFLLTIGADGLKPKAFEVVFASQFEAMRADGNLAHEPNVGEFASFVSLNEGHGEKRIPSYMYKMVDTRFLLARSVNHYLNKVEPARAAEFFSRKSSAGIPYKQLLLRNFQFVLDSAEPFYKQPKFSNMIAIEKGMKAGQWRDSDEGLGGGKYPFDVNVALVPAALTAISEVAQKMKEPAFSALEARAQASAKVWTEKAFPFFQVSLTAAQVEDKVLSYEKQLGLALEKHSQPITFSAISLDEVGSPVPIMNSDGGVVLLEILNLPEDRVLQIIHTVTEPFPVGLLSPVGMFVSNGAYAPQAIRKRWDFNGYHGVVVWPWQELLMAKGIAAQLGRHDLKLATIEQLEAAELALWKVIYKTAAYLSIELYTSQIRDGRLVPAEYGHFGTQETGSTIIQGWSKLALLVAPPQRVVDQLGPMPSPSSRDRQF